MLYLKSKLVRFLALLAAVAFVLFSAGCIVLPADYGYGGHRGYHRHHGDHGYYHDDDDYRYWKKR